MPMMEHKLRARYAILLVDDDETFRHAQKRMLSRLRLADSDTTFEVSEAGSGPAAMAFLEEHPVDCMLLDYKMAGGDGSLWLPRILEKRPDLAVVMVTGVGSEQLAAKCMREGAMDYLVKGDISLSDLERAILNAVEKVELRKLVEVQRQQLVEAERHRAMIASLGAARHHLGQPASVVRVYLELMARAETDPEMRTMIQTCLEATDAISGILTRLDGVTEFRTEPYLPNGMDDSTRDGNEILQI